MAGTSLKSYSFGHGLLRLLPARNNRVFIDRFTDYPHGKTLWNTGISLQDTVFFYHFSCIPDARCEASAILLPTRIARACRVDNYGRFDKEAPLRSLPVRPQSS